MTISPLLVLGCVGVVLPSIVALNWHAIRHMRRANQADHLHQEERLRVLSNYAHIRDGRCYHPQQYPESADAPELQQRRKQR